MSSRKSWGPPSGTRGSLCSLETVEPQPQKGAVKSFFKSKSFKLNLTLSDLVTKKISMTRQQRRLGGVLPTFMHQFWGWDFVYFITKP